MAKMVFDDIEVKDKAETFFDGYEYYTEQLNGKLKDFDDFKKHCDFIDYIFDEYFYEIVITDSQWKIIYDAYVKFGSVIITTLNNKTKWVEMGEKLLSQLASELQITLEPNLKNLLEDFIF